MGYCCWIPIKETGLQGFGWFASVGSCNILLPYLPNCQAGPLFFNCFVWTFCRFETLYLTCFSNCTLCFFLLGIVAVNPKVDIGLSLGRNKRRRPWIYWSSDWRRHSELGASFLIRSGSHSDTEITSPFSPLLHVYWGEYTFSILASHCSWRFHSLFSCVCGRWMNYLWNQRHGCVFLQLYYIADISYSWYYVIRCSHYVCFCLWQLIVSSFQRCHCSGLATVRKIRYKALLSPERWISLMKTTFQR